MKLSLLIPVYNEERNIESVLKYVKGVEFPCEVEYVIVDDCSTDGTWDLLQSYKDDQAFVIKRHDTNKGKGAALHTAISLASGDIIAVQDADFEYEARELPELIKPVLDGRADVVYGSRFSKQCPQVHRTFHYLVNRILTLLSNVFSGLYLSDMETCYKIFRSDILKALPLESERFGFEPEVTAMIAKLKVRVHEYPISYHPRTYIEGKKISWKDGVAAVWFILKYNWRALPDKAKESLPKDLVPASRQWL